jgi:hypothetical protein
MVELIKQWEEEDEHWLAAPAARIPRRRSISTRPVMVMRDRPPREMNRFTLGPGLGDASGLKGVPQAPRGANPFSPGLGDEPGPLRLYEPGPMGDVHCSVYRATWPDLGSRPRTRPGPKVPDQRAFFSTSECCCPKQKNLLSILQPKGQAHLYIRSRWCSRAAASSAPLGFAPNLCTC